jgi:hypothetical protein
LSGSTSNGRWINWAGDEAGFKFQSLAVVLAKLRWPELIAGERHNDRGLDAYAPASASADRKGKGLACSTTSTLDKVKKDAKKVKENYPDVSTLASTTAARARSALPAHACHAPHGSGRRIARSRQQLTR